MDKKALTFDEECIYIGGISRPTMYGLIGDGADDDEIKGWRIWLLRGNFVVIDVDVLLLGVWLVT